MYNPYSPSLANEEQKKKLSGALSSGSFSGPAATAVQEGVGTTALKAGGRAVGQEYGAMAGAAAGSVFGPVGTVAGGAIGGALGSSLLGGGDGGPTAVAPKFDGGAMVANNQNQDTSVQVAGNAQLAPPLNPQQQDPRAFDREEYMRRFGGNSYV